MKLLSVLFASLLLIGCSDSTPEQITAQATTQTGEEIYLMYCAQCHGRTGDGIGIIKLDRPARSFIDGGFSFGNTVKAISKTTLSGIPGSPMPPFIEILDANQISLVVEHVRSFAPTLAPVTADETEMIVDKRPVVVRGTIPPVKDGLPMHPRGLLVGNPDGFSYEYRADNVRLLAIRQGKFVQRTDWTDRGGTPLKILGQIVVLVDGGNPPPIFTKDDGTALYAKLASTSVTGQYGVIRYELVDEFGTTVASVSEECKLSTGVRALINQEFTISCTEPVRMIVSQQSLLDGSPEISIGTRRRTIIHAARGKE